MRGLLLSLDNDCVVGCSVFWLPEKIKPVSHDFVVGFS